MKKNLLYIMLAISTLSLSACYDNNKDLNQNNQITSSQKNLDQIQNLIEQTENITFGKKSNNPIVIFFDPQCIHCHNLFNTTQQPEFKDEYFVWIPLGFLNEKSPYQVSMIMNSIDPSKKLIEHENLYSKDHNGLSIPKIISIDQKIIDKNNNAFKQFKFSGVPVSIKNNKEGKMIVAKGGLPSENLKNFIDQ